MTNQNFHRKVAKSGILYEKKLGWKLAMFSVKKKKRTTEYMILVKIAFKNLYFYTI